MERVVKRNEYGNEKSDFVKYIRIALGDRTSITLKQNWFEYFRTKKNWNNEVS